MYNWVLSALVVAVVIHSIDCVCDSSPDCQSLRFREGLSTGAPCCQCRNVRGFRCRRGERFVPIQGLGRCCSDPSRVIRWNEGFIPTSRVSESNTVYFTPRIEREFLVPRREIIYEYERPQRDVLIIEEPQRQRFTGRNVASVIEGDVQPAGDAGDDISFQPRIIGGQPDFGRLAAYQAAILRVGLFGQNIVCGGSIIHPNVILTAAHCFLQSADPRQYIVRVGDFNSMVPDPGQQDIPMASIRRHALFRGDRGAFDYDIALVFLSRRIQFVPGRVERIGIPQPGVPVRGLNSCLISGWGRTHPTIGGPSNLLHIANTVVPDARGQEMCRQRTGGRMTSRMLCAGGMNIGSDTCVGDSGGPLACRIGGRTVLVGITSWGPNPCAQAQIPGQYTNVQAFYGWILQTFRAG